MVLAFLVAVVVLVGGFAAWLAPGLLLASGSAATAWRPGTWPSRPDWPLFR
jgi:hypothetical protein